MVLLSMAGISTFLTLECFSEKILRFGVFLYNWWHPVKMIKDKEPDENEKLIN